MSCADRTTGGGPSGPSPLRFRKLVQRIREEFDYFPGLSLSAVEAARFWALDLALCQKVLKELVMNGFLIRDSEERYVMVGPPEGGPYTSAAGGLKTALYLNRSA